MNQDLLEKNKHLTTYLTPVHHHLPEQVQLEPGNLLLDGGAGNDPTGSYMLLLAQSLARVHLRI